MGVPSETSARRSMYLRMRVEFPRKPRMILPTSTEKTVPSMLPPRHRPWGLALRGTDQSWLVTTGIEEIGIAIAIEMVTRGLGRCHAAERTPMVRKCGRKVARRPSARVNAQCVFLSTAPARSPVSTPSATATRPSTITYSIPRGGRSGSS